MNELKLVKSEMFGQSQVDIYSKSNEVYMTLNQLADCLGYKDKSGVQKIVDRNDYLKEPQFSGTDNLSLPSGGTQNTRIFTEDGIYEVTMLARTEKAKEFRSWVRTILKSLRSGKAKIIGMTEYQQMVAKTREENVRVRKAQILERLANQYDGTYRQVLQAHATKELTGDFLLPLPEIGQKTYSATEIGRMFGVSANMIGHLANANGLKTDRYGSYFKDKAKNCNKEIPCFRYFESVIPEIERLLK